MFERWLAILDRLNDVTKIVNSEEIEKNKETEKKGNNDNENENSDRFTR